MFSLAGKTILVTGAAQGIGLGIAEVCAEAGADVFTCDLDSAKGETAAKQLRERGGKVQFTPADVSQRQQVNDFVEFAANQTGRVDAVCSNAAYTVANQHDVAGASDEEWEKNFRIGLMGAHYSMQCALPYMIQQKSGSFIVISSIQALAACPASTPYTSIKAAQLGFVRSAALDYGPHNIRVNALCPGAIKVGYSPEPGTPAHTWQVSKTMLGRIGQPRDIGYAVLFLASDESAYITGAVIPVDGGWTAM